ncbi:MAG: hypothetical protein AABY22_02815, partial [Nanoarchaeota archaeon]
RKQNNDDFVQNLSHFTITTQKNGQKATAMDMDEYNLWNPNIIGDPFSYDKFINEINDTQKKVNPIVKHQRPQNFMVTNGKSMKKFKSVYSSSGVVNSRTDEWIKNVNPVAFQYLKDKYTNSPGGAEFQAVSSVGIATRGLRGISNANLLRLPSPTERNKTNRLKSLQGFKGGIGKGPLNLGKKDILVSNTLTTSSQMLEYLRQNGKGDEADYSISAPKINFMKLRLSGAINPTIGNYTMGVGRGSGAATVSVGIKKKVHKRFGASNKMATNQPMIPIPSEMKTLSKAIYSPKRVDALRGNKRSNRVMKPFKDAINKVGTPTYDSTLTARFYENHIQQYTSRDLKRGRQRNGVYANTAAVYPTTAPYQTLFGNQPNYIPLASPDGQHGGNIFGRQSKADKTINDHVSSQHKAIARAADYSDLSPALLRYKPRIPKTF